MRSTKALIFRDCSSVGRCISSMVAHEADYIRYVLEHCNGNRTQAAQILGIDRVSLWRKLKKYDLTEED